MKIIYIFLLGMYFSIQGAAFSTDKVIMVRDCGISSSSGAQILHCFSDVPGLDKPLCFCTEKEKDDFIVSYMQAGKHAWQTLQSRMIEHCSSGIVHHELFCPDQNETFESFLQRTEKKITYEIKSIEDRQVHVSVRKDFSGIPWHVLRYMLAVNLQMHLFKPDKILPKLGATLLDLAVQYQDIEMMFFLIDYGARKMIKPESFELFVRHMLQSSDERSVQVLKEMSDGDINFDWPDYEWATYLPREHVIEKLHIITRAQLDARGVVKSVFCIPIKKVLALPEDTPGAHALKFAALGLSDLQNCESNKRHCIVS